MAVRKKVPVVGVEVFSEGVSMLPPTPRTAITKLRQERGWSRAELARQARLNSSTVGQIESGRLKPYKSQLEKLATAFGVPVEQIKTEADGKW